MRKLAMVTVGVMALVAACGGGSGETAPTQSPGSQGPLLYRYTADNGDQRYDAEGELARD